MSASDPSQQPAFDLDEDLFDFPDVARGGVEHGSEEDLDEILASFRDPPAEEEELLAVPPAPSAVRGAPEPASPLPRVAASPGLPISPSTGVPAGADAAAPVAHAGRRRIPRGAIAIVLAVTLLNSSLAVVALRGRRSDTQVRAVDHLLEAPPVTRTGTGHGAGAGGRGLPDPESIEPLDDHPTLDEARKQMSRGEYAAARQRVYGLLAIIDRLEDPRRSTVEADCQFLIAQSLHLEALERMGAAR